MSGLPSVSRVRNYTPDSTQVRQGGRWDEPEKSGSSSTVVLSESEILPTMGVPAACVAILWGKQNKLKCMLFFN